MLEHLTKLNLFKTSSVRTLLAEGEDQHVCNTNTRLPLRNLRITLMNLDRWHSGKEQILRSTASLQDIVTRALALSHAHSPSLSVLPIFLEQLTPQRLK